MNEPETRWQFFQGDANPRHSPLGSLAQTGTLMHCGTYKQYPEFLFSQFLSEEFFKDMLKDPSKILF